jgi:hypothetical protein
MIGKRLFFAHAGTSISQVYTLDGFDSETIGGATTYSLYTNGETLELVGTSSGYVVLSHYAKTDWSSTVATTITGTVSNPTKGTMAVDTIKWRRNGKFAQIGLNFQQTAAGAGAGSGSYLILLPGSLTADTTQVELNTSTDATIAHGIGILPHTVIAGNTGATNTVTGGATSMYDSTHFRVHGLSAGTSAFIWSSSSYALTNTTVTMVGYFYVPISGWNP